MEALGCSLKADDFRLTLPSQALENARTELPSGDGPLLLMAPSGVSNDWPNQRWSTLPETIRTVRRPCGAKASAGVGLLSEPRPWPARRGAQQLPTHSAFGGLSNVPLVPLGGPASIFPNGPRFDASEDGPLEAIGEDEVLTALGF